ncbi:MAG: hypothetical protein QW735_00860 [archaeon]
MKGQESAPIELLLGTIILSFVLVLVYFTYQNLSGKQYSAALQVAFSKLGSELEFVYQGAVGTKRVLSLDFSPLEGTGKKTAIKILHGHKETCLKQTGKENCWQLIAVQGEEGQAGVLYSLALNIPTSIAIKFKNATGDEAVCENEYSSWSSPIPCQWKPTRYTLTIEKTSNNEIIISQVS